MVTDRSILEQLEEYVQICIDLEGVEVTIVDEDKSPMMLSALPKS